MMVKQNTNEPTWSWHTISFPDGPWPRNARDWILLPSKCRTTDWRIDSNVSSFLYCNAITPGYTAHYVLYIITTGRVRLQIAIVKQHGNIKR